MAVVGSGYSWLQAWMFHAGAANVRDGKVFAGRAWAGGRSRIPTSPVTSSKDRPLDPKRTCRTFSYCTALMRNKKNELGQFAAGCPPFDKETYGPIWDRMRKRLAGGRGLTVGAFNSRWWREDTPTPALPRKGGGSK